MQKQQQQPQQKQEQLKQQQQEQHHHQQPKITVALKRPKLSISIVGLAVCLVHSIIWDFLQNKQQLSIFHRRNNYSWDAIEEGFWSTTISVTDHLNQNYQEFFRFNDNNNDRIENDEDDNFVMEGNVSYPFTFGGCLLIKDDNLIISEWLAYHYTVLPLRHLIVAIDPLSITTPEPIFEKFRSIGMTIEVWTGNSYFNRGRLRQFDPHNYTQWDGFRMYVRRQMAFYTNCLQKFQSMPNVSWVMVADTDEYITYNTILPMEQKEFEKRQQQLQRQKRTNQTSNNIHHSIRGRLPRTIGKQNETIAHYIAKHQSKLAEQGNFSSRILRNDSLCTVLPRVNFVAVDIKLEGKNNDKTTTTTTSTSIPNTSIATAASLSSFLSPTFDLPPHARRPIIPKGFDISQFHSLRFFFHNNIYGRAMTGKSLVNVKNMNSSSNDKMIVHNPHRIYKDSCDNEAYPQVHSEKDGFIYPFRFNHYTGSLETFIARPERTVNQWWDRNNLTKMILDFNNKNIQYDESLMEWFPEFIRLVGGREKAFELTQQCREDAIQEWAEIKQMYPNNNTRPPLIFRWD